MDGATWAAYWPSAQLGAKAAFGPRLWLRPADLSDPVRRGFLRAVSTGIKNGEIAYRFETVAAPTFLEASWTPSACWRRTTKEPRRPWWRLPGAPVRRKRSFSWRSSVN